MDLENNAKQITRPLIGLQSNQVKRTPQDYINELIIFNIEPASRFKNAIMSWLLENWIH